MEEVKKTPDKNENIIFVFLNRFIRIKDVIKWSAISFIGFILGISTLSIQDNLLPFLVFFICTFFIMSFTFSINNYYDAESDRENPRSNNAIATGRISQQTGAFLILTFVIIPLAVSIVFKLEVFIFCAFLLLLGWSYSSPPIRLKGRPGFDIIWHFSAFFFVVIWGSLISGSINIINWLVAISIGVFSCIGQIWNHIIDYKFDRDSKTTTFAVKFGLEKTEKILRLFIGLHIVFLIPLISLFCVNYFETIISLVGLSVLGLAVIRPKRNTFPKINSYQYYLAVGLGGPVYVSCMIYHLLLISGNPIIFNFLDFIKII